MKLTPKGFKQPTTGDPTDLYQFVGDNMDLLEVELNKRPQNIFHYSNTPPADKKLFWIDTTS